MYTLLTHSPIVGIFALPSVLQLQVMSTYCALNYMVPALFPLVLKFEVDGECPTVT